MTRFMEHQKETKRVYDACMAYWELSRVLFSGKKDSITFIKDLPSSSPFYKDALDVAKDMGIEWEKMTIDQSDAITLALLETLFMRIRSKESVDVVVNVRLYGKNRASQASNGNPKGKGSC